MTLDDRKFVLKAKIEELNVLLVGHGIHGGIGIAVVGETNEAKATAAVGVTILHDNLFHFRTQHSKSP